MVFNSICNFSANEEGMSAGSKDMKSFRHRIIFDEWRSHQASEPTPCSFPENQRPGGWIWWQWQTQWMRRVNWGPIYCTCKVGCRRRPPGTKVDGGREKGCRLAGQSTHPRKAIAGVQGPTSVQVNCAPSPLCEHPHHQILCTALHTAAWTFSLQLCNKFPMFIL